MKLTTIFTLLIVLLVIVACGETYGPMGDEDAPVLESTTPFTYDKKNNEYVVNIDSDGGEYVFSAPKNDVDLGVIHRNGAEYHHDDRYSFQNEYITAKVEYNTAAIDITINIVPNNTGEKVTYIFFICGLDSFTKIVFNQSKAE